MEPHGIVDCTIQIWNLGTSNLQEFVSDDNASSRAALKYPIQTQIEKGIINVWP